MVWTAVQPNFGAYPPQKGELLKPDESQPDPPWKPAGEYAVLFRFAQAALFFTAQYLESWPSALPRCWTRDPAPAWVKPITVHT